VNLLREKLRASGHHCLQMGGGGGSSSSANTTTSKDNRISLQSGVATSGDGNSINILDGGAIKNAFDFATAQGKESLTFATTAQGQALDSLKTTSNLVKDAYTDAKGRGALTDKILIGAIGVTGLVALMAIRKRG
jgi:hypothetical protein